MKDTAFRIDSLGSLTAIHKPTIITRLCLRRIRDEIYSYRHRLKEYNKTHPQERIYINESHQDKLPTLQQMLVVQEKQ